MDQLSHILAILERGEVVPGRTMLQKLVYLLARMRGESLPFRAHFYGPYSEEVQSAVEQLVRAGLAEQTVTVYEAWHPDQFDAYRYDYRITDAGREAAAKLPDELLESAGDLVNRAKSEHAWNQGALAIAAKLAYLRDIDPESKGRDFEGLAAQFGWEISPNAASQGAALLSALEGEHATG